MTRQGQIFRKREFLKPSFLGVGFLQKCQYREVLPRFPITQVARRVSKRGKRFMSSISTIGTPEIVLLPKSKTIYTRCHANGQAGAWHCLQIVRHRKSRRKRKSYFCPRCCGSGVMIYFGGLGKKDIYCNNCVPLPSITSVLNSASVKTTRRSIAIKDYDSLGKLLKGGFKGLISYRIAMDIMMHPGRYVPDLRGNDKRHRFVIKKVVKKDLLRCKLQGRLLYVENKIIVR